MTNEPVQHQTPVPWREPLEAYRRLRSRGAVLLDGLGAHPESRHAYVALSPVLKASLHGDSLDIVHEDGRAETRRGDPLELMRELFNEHHVPGMRGFTAGFVGYFGYGFVHAVEPTLPREDASTPDALWQLCQDVLVFDRAERTATLWTTDLGSDTSAPARARAILADLEQHADGGAVGPVGAWTTSLDQDAFEARVRTVREHVRTGDLFQANIATRFQAECAADPAELFSRLATSNPSPYMMLFEAADHAIVSCSPEQLLAIEGNRIRTRPIAGTRRRGATPDEDAEREKELLRDPKEQAEHTMLVDLLRNDLAKVCKPATVRVAEAWSVERYRHVMHLVSRVEGELQGDLMDAIAAVFPGGTITGAPKHRACTRIAEAEPVARGPYTGSGGFIGLGHDCHLNILIRTLVVEPGKVSVHAGSGIVADSVPEREWMEANSKAEALLQAATGEAKPGGDRLGEVTRHGAWNPPRPGAQCEARVLLVDNYDSFVWNLADYCAVSGADVKVVRNDVDWRAAMAEHQATHVILGPGPGWPRDAGATMEAARELVGQIPVLGVCLGHQALALAAGATVDVHTETVHGRTSPIRHAGAGLFEGLPDGFAATRYHSLVACDIPEPWVVDATLDDGTVMAIRHVDHPAFGLQFHPESFCTEHGLKLLARFLAC